MGLREDKQQATRDRMVAAARRLFEENGYGETTIDMIAAAAGVSARTFHRYFETKEGVVVEAGTDIVQRAIELLPRPAAVADIVLALATAADEGVEDGKVQWSVRLRREDPDLRSGTPAWMHRWSEMVAVALAAQDGVDAPAFRHRVISTAAVHTSAAAADEWILRQPQRRLTELAQEAIEILRLGLAPTSPT